jgi:hypothetical protein
VRMLRRVASSQAISMGDVGFHGDQYRLHYAGTSSGVFLQMDVEDDASFANGRKHIDFAIGWLSLRGRQDDWTGTVISGLAMTGYQAE